MDAPFKKQRVEASAHETPDLWRINSQEFQDDPFPLTDLTSMAQPSIVDQQEELYAAPDFITEQGFVTRGESQKEEWSQLPMTTSGISQSRIRKKTRCPKPDCAKTYSNATFLKNHILKKHAQLKDFACAFPNCTYKTLEPNLYQEHMVLVHNSAPNDALYLEMHKQISAALNPYFNDYKFKCKACDRLFPKKSTLTAHVTSSHKTLKKAECFEEEAPQPITTYEFLADSRFIPATAQNHSSVNALNKHRCPELGCVSNFSEIHTLKNHILKEHAQLKLFACEIPDCCFTTAQPSSYQEHMATIHKCRPNATLYLEMHKQLSAALNPYFGDWKFKCEHCDRLFPEKSSLAAHVGQAHKIEHESTVTTKVLPKLNLIQTAIQSVAGAPKNLECPKLGCGEAFCNLALLNKHILKEHAQLKPFQCEVPDCRFKTREPHSYRGHMSRVHKASLNTPGYLELQKLISAALNPYFSDWKFKCETCDRLFASQGSLTLHVNQTHEKESELITAD